MADFEYWTVLGVHFFSYANKNKSGEITNACVISCALPSSNNKDPRSWGYNCKEFFIGSNSPIYLQAQDLKRESQVRLLFNQQGYVEDMLIKESKKS